MEKSTMLALILAALFMFGCASVSSQKSQGDAGGASSSSLQANASGAAGASGTTSASGASKTRLVLGDGKAQLEKLLAGRSNLSFKADYIISQSSGDSKGAVMRQSLYTKGGNTRTDVALGSGAFARSASVFRLGNETYICQASDGPGVCMRSAGAVQEQAAGSEGAEANLEQFTVGLLSPRVIAGTLSQCFLLTSEDSSSETESCYSPEGIPLYSSALDKASGIELTSEAQSYSTNVSDEGLTLPFPLADEQPSSPSQQQFSGNSTSQKQLEQCLGACGYIANEISRSGCIQSCKSQFS